MADMERVAPEIDYDIPVDGFDLYNLDAVKAVDDLSDAVTTLYFPLRGQEGYGTERAILVGPTHAPHRENDMEHSAHIALCTIILEDGEEAYGFRFPSGFRHGYCTQDSITHDLIEKWVPDTDAMTKNVALLRSKSKLERAAATKLSLRNDYIGRLAVRMLAHMDIEDIEIKTMADIEHFTAPLVIMADGGRRWQDWEGETTDCTEMRQRIRGKLSTSFGHAMFDEVERRVLLHPEYFEPPINS
jgi:hypothetical protein